MPCLHSPCVHDAPGRVLAALTEHQLIAAFVIDQEIGHCFLTDIEMFRHACDTAYPVLL